MENNNNVVMIDSDYQNLIEKTKSYCEQRDEYVFFATNHDSELSKIHNLVDKWKSKYFFELIFSELGYCISTWNSEESIERLYNQLRSYKEAIIRLTNTLERLEKEYNLINSLDDRFGKNEVEQEYRFFMNSINTIKIKDVNNIIEVVIPDLIDKKNKVIAAFEKEKMLCKHNKEYALILKSTIDKLQKYVDKYDNKRVCKRGIEIINSVLNDTLDSDPNKVKTILSALNQKLKIIEKEYNEDSSKIKGILSEAKNKSYMMWEEDYVDFVNKVRQCPYYLDYSIEDIKNEYYDLCKKKKNNINDFCNELSKRQQKRLSKKIDEIKCSFVKSSSLDDLLKNGGINVYIFIIVVLIIVIIAFFIL